jgi:hypothetical protein
MSEENTKSQNGDSTNPVPFEDFVRQQFTAISTRLDNLSGEVSSLRQETVDRFVQISRQIKLLDQKVDIFIQEHIYLKDEWREVRDSLKPKN